MRIVLRHSQFLAPSSATIGKVVTTTTTGPMQHDCWTYFAGCKGVVRFDPQVYGRLIVPVGVFLRAPRDLGSVNDWAVYEQRYATAAEDGADLPASEDRVRVRKADMLEPVAFVFCA